MSIRAVEGNPNTLAQVRRETIKSKDTENNIQVLKSVHEPTAVHEKTADEPESPSAVDIESTVKELNKAVQNIQRDIHFSIHDETGESVIQVIDRNTEEVVKQFPPEEVLKVSSKLEGLQGLLFEEEA